MDNNETTLDADDGEEYPTGLYDWHAATGAEVPHIAVYQHLGGGDERRIADFYVHGGDVGGAEALAMELCFKLNEQAQAPETLLDEEEYPEAPSE